MVAQPESSVQVTASQDRSPPVFMHFWLMGHPLVVASSEVQSTGVAATQVPVPSQVIPAAHVPEVHNSQI